MWSASAPPQPQTPVDPRPAMPLEYGTPASDPLLPLIRALSVLFLFLGAFEFANLIGEIVEVGRNWFFRSNQPFGFIIVMETPVALLQILAGALNARRADRINVLWLWIWSSIGAQFVNFFLIVSWLLSAELRNPNAHLAQIVAEVLLRLTQIPIGCGWALIVMLILRYRQRLMTPLAR
jgi:hypothetical protein